MVRAGQDRAPAVEDAFRRVLADGGDALRRALVARFGPEVGTEAFADAMAWAYEHRERLVDMDNPLGYLYRVGQSAARPHRRWLRRVVGLDTLAATPLHGMPSDASDDRMLVRAALERLTHEQRVAVFLVHGYGYSYAEVAATLNVSVAAVTNHVHRGMRKLRSELEVER